MEGTVPVPPGPPLRFTMCRITFTELPLQGGATAAGAEAQHAVTPKSVKKNILKVYQEN
jgi:hypothetical protein